MKQFLYGVLMAATVACSSAAFARDYPIDPGAYVVETHDAWRTCNISHYAPKASGDARAYQVAIDFQTEPFRWEKPLRFQRRSPGLQLTGRLFEDFAGAIADKYDLRIEFIGQGECNNHSSREAALEEIERARKTTRTFYVVAPPTTEMLSRASREIMRDAGAHVATSANGSAKKVTSDTKSEVSPAVPKSPSKYIEVSGPNGTIRLSPEVMARNKAAAEEHQRKLQAHADAVAQAKANNDRSAAQHAADLARHAESVAKAASEKREYERQLATNAAEVAVHKIQIANAGAGNERTFQATGAIRTTKDEAMASLMGQNLPPITNVQCKEVTFYKPARWTCWGTYRQAVTRSSTSKQ